MRRKDKYSAPVKYNKYPYNILVVLSVYSAITEWIQGDEGDPTNILGKVSKIICVLFVENSTKAEPLHPCL